MRWMRQGGAAALLMACMTTGGCVQIMTRCDREMVAVPYDATANASCGVVAPWMACGSSVARHPAQAPLLPLWLPPAAAMSVAFAAETVVSAGCDTILLPIDLRARSEYGADQAFWDAYLRAEGPPPTRRQVRRHGSRHGLEYLERRLGEKCQRAVAPWPSPTLASMSPEARDRLSQRLECLVELNMCPTEVAGWPDLSPELVARLLAVSDGGKVHRRLLANPSVPLQTLDELLAAAGGDAVQRLAQNPALPPARFDSLVREADPLVLSCLARNPGLPRHLMVRFANSDDSKHRLALACNRGLPDDLALQLAHDPAAARELFKEGRDDFSPELLREMGAVCRAGSLEDYGAFTVSVKNRP